MNVRRPERARNRGSSGPGRLDDTRERERESGSWTCVSLNPRLESNNEEEEEVLDSSADEAESMRGVEPAHFCP